jgi:hypothetical protein
MSQKTRTIYDPPPIPYRSRDWCAFEEGHQEYGPFGWGETEQEALKDLAEAVEDS